MSRPCLLAGVLLATFASPAWAATPARLHLSGHLTTAGGEPVTAALPMTFRLYAGAEDADALWAEPHDAVDVLDGRFDVVLGGTVALDPALLARPLPLFAGVTVGEAGGGDGVEVLPRTEVGGVALALRVPVADRAETLSDVSALAGQVSARLLADHLADLRGDSGPDGTPGVDGSDGVHCWAALGDPEPGQPWTAADCRGAPGAPGGPGSDGPPGADCWASVGDLTGDDLEDTRDCQGPRGPRGPPDVRESLLGPVHTVRLRGTMLPITSDRLSDAVQVAAEGTVLSVSVWLDCLHPDLREVQLWLRSPDGTEVLLHDRTSGDRLLGWSGVDFEPSEGLGPFLGRPAAGQWALVSWDQEDPQTAGACAPWSLELVVRPDGGLGLAGDLEADGLVRAEQGAFGSLRVGDADLAERLDALSDRLWCLETCHPSRFDDCVDRICGEADRLCLPADPLDDGTRCNGGRGRCRDGVCCTPATCEPAAGTRCGRVDDGCGGQLWCGGCDAGEWCGADRTCLARSCRGVSCAAHPLGWPARCNARGHCEYAPAGEPLRAEIYVPRVTFPMGSPEDEAGRSGDEGPVHDVALSRGFFIGKHEVTVAQYQACREAGECGDPSVEDWPGPQGLNTVDDGRSSHPANGLQWDQARTYCAWTGGRLPSEAEWELAATGPWHRRYPWGDGPEPSCAGGLATFDEEGVGPGCGANGTAPVGSKLTGASWWGALDMAGNLWEWVEDCWHVGYEGAPADGSAWTTDCIDDGVRLRGGSWYNDAGSLRVAGRLLGSSGTRSANVGARCARDLPPEACGDRVDNDGDGALGLLYPAVTDDFGDGNYDGWEVRRGSWSVQDGRLHGQGHGQDAWVYSTTSYEGDLDFEVTVHYGTGHAALLFESAAGNHPTDQYRLEVWSQDSPAYANSIGLQGQQAGQGWSLTDGNEEVAVPITNPSRIRLRRVGDRFDVFVNGELAMSRVDPDALPPGGHVGLHVVWAYNVSFDDVLVRTCR